MALATYKDLCIDAVDPARLGRFWGAALHLEVEELADGDVRLTGPTPRHTVWVNRVPEPVSVKQRVHLDVRAHRTDDPVRISTWWADVLGADRHDDEEHGVSYLEPVPEAPFEALVFVPVPEPKTVKNRIHVDVTTPDVRQLLEVGAHLLRAPDGEIGWHVLADPDGNEFCAFEV